MPLTRLVWAFTFIAIVSVLSLVPSGSAMEKPKKTYHPFKGPLQDLAKGYGGCVATDMVTVQGLPVRYMYREKPTDQFDSGWSFFSGFESDEYTNNPANSGVYDVNTIANYDPSIVPHLDAPPGSSFEKPDDQGAFVVVTMGQPSPPEFPVVQGRYQMTKRWAITLPSEFQRRTEDDSLVLWRRGITLWIIAWSNAHSESADKRLNEVRAEVSKSAFDLETERDKSVVRFSYRLTEKRKSGTVHALYAFAFSDAGHVQVAIYLDAERDLETARAIWRSIESTP